MVGDQRRHHHRKDAMTDQRTGAHMRTRPNVRGRAGELPRSLGAAQHVIPNGADYLTPGTQVALGRIQIPVLGLFYEPTSGDLDWWDALITAATEVRNDLAKLRAHA